MTKNIKHVEMFDDNYVNLKKYDGLGFLDGIIIPHYDETREKAYKELVKSSKFKVYKLTNDDSILITDDYVEVIEKS